MIPRTKDGLWVSARADKRLWVKGRKEEMKKYGLELERHYSSFVWKEAETNRICLAAWSGPGTQVTQGTGTEITIRRPFQTRPVKFVKSKRGGYKAQAHQLGGLKCLLTVPGHLFDTYGTNELPTSYEGCVPDYMEKLLDVHFNVDPVVEDTPVAEPIVVNSVTTEVAHLALVMDRDIGLLVSLHSEQVCLQAFSLVLLARGLSK